MPDSLEEAVSVRTYYLRKIVREMAKEIAELKEVNDYLFNYIKDFENPEPMGKEE